MVNDGTTWTFGCNELRLKPEPLTSSWPGFLTGVEILTDIILSLDQMLVAIAQLTPPFEIVIALLVLPPCGFLLSQLMSKQTLCDKY